MSEENKQAVYKRLDELGIKYEVDEHEAVFTIAEIDKMGTFDKGVGCKNLFLRDAAGKRHFLIVAEEHSTVDLKLVRAELGCSRLSFGSEERLWKCLKLTPGSVSPLGVINDKECKVEVVFEKKLVGENKLGFHPNDNTATVWLSFDDVIEYIKANGNSVVYIQV